MTAITRLEAESFLRLRVVDITPQPGVPVKITGRNAQGKSSVLAAIEATFGGKAAVAAQPVHDGDDAGWTRVTLDDGTVVERRYRVDGKTTLHVTGPDGAKISRAQGELDQLLGALTFEPLRFRQSAPAQQRAVLAGLVGIDLEERDRERKALYDARTEAGKEARRLEGVVASLPAPVEGVPSEPVDLRELLDVLNAARETLAENGAERVCLERDREELARIRQQIESLCDRRDEMESELMESERVVASLVDPDIDDLERQVAEIGATNDAVRAARAYADAVHDLEAHRGEQKRLTQAIEAHDNGVRSAIETADLPVAGLGFDEDGVTFNGQPFSQASAAESIRVCFAVAAAERPGLDIALIRDGSLLDDESMALLADEAARSGCQLWLERVGADSSGFVIEDGEVVGVPAAGWTGWDA